MMIVLPATTIRQNPKAAHGKRTHTDGVVIHTIEGTAAGAVSWFENPQAQGVAAHVIVGKTKVTQITDLDNICWHCPGANSGWIGIEHEGSASMSKVQWLRKDNRKLLRMSANRTAWICWRYKLGEPKRGKNVKGHGDFPAPNNHTDPGKGWPWFFYMFLCRRAYKNLKRTGRWA